ncbi:MAG: FKBP-type peptidyl-prolyl cis-trans isomerase [Solirubrobacteraceae bacterium]
MSVAPASPTSLANGVPGGTPGPVEGASAGAPRPEACPLCGAPLGPEQEWCLHCGAAARTRLATSSNWKAPIIAIATVAVLSLGVLAASLTALAGDSGSSSTQATTVIASTPTTASSTPAASSPGATSPSGTSASTYPGTATGPLSTEPTVTVPTGPPPSKTQIQELITGTGAEALPGDTVTVNYVGVLYNGGALFDSSWRRDKRFTFALGTDQVIAGWNEGVTGMKVGGRRELIVPASAAYGAQGLETRPVPIPPNAALVFIVDLLEVSKGTTPAPVKAAAPAKAAAPTKAATPTTPASGAPRKVSAAERLRQVEAEDQKARLHK